MELMGHLSSMFNGLARSFWFRRGKNSGICSGRDAAETMAKEAKKNELILRSSGVVNVDGSNNFASVFSKRGRKGVNQDCCIVWEVCLKCWQISYLMFHFSLPRHCRAKKQGKIKFLFTFVGYNNLKEKTY